MHELSLAKALVRLAEPFRPPGHVVQELHVEAGPLQAIEPTAMQLAWQAASTGTPLEHARLDLRLLPWTLSCDACGRQWESAELSDCCTCAASCVRVVGGDQLQLISLDVTPKTVDNDK